MPELAEQPHCPHCGTTFRRDDPAAPPVPYVDGAVCLYCTRERSWLAARALVLVLAAALMVVPVLVEVFWLVPVAAAASLGGFLWSQKAIRAIHARREESRRAGRRAR
jgi:hypothetical protein